MLLIINWVQTACNPNLKRTSLV